ncbi:hypothetical protein P8C59_007493 [Phyllachora maydis]|uniref:Major facilitator superfamily (MFS) profile domain-containing protein n=1 Tax=Phyllachora maydis TaxID=1825666 RepID=A0AAD9I9N4_9PEZI|nr:hypothetical protein P8C59_007493 [Phyllachora maydis]
MSGLASLPRRAWPQVLTLFASRVVDFYQQAAFQTVAPYQLSALGDPAALAAHVGLATGLFTAAQVATSVWWGGAADRHGRKAVLLASLAGSAAACLGQALAPGAAAVVAWRAVAGAVNGSVPAARAAMSEAVDPRHRPAAFALLVLSFNLASLLGPAVSVAVMPDPVPVPVPDVSPAAGARWLARFPYAPPSLLSALFVAAGALLVLCVLEETAGRRTERAGLGKAEAAREPDRASASSSSSHPLWTRRFGLVVASVALLDTHLGAFSSVWPLFISAELGLPPSSLATTTGFLGLGGLVLQLLVVPRLTTRHGTMRPYRWTLFLFPLSYLLMPLLRDLSFSGSPLFWPAVGVLLALHVVARTFGLLAVLLLLNGSDGPLGRVHGIGNATTGLARTLGALAGGAVFGLGRANAMPGLAWWLSAAVATGAWVLSFSLEES